MGLCRRSNRGVGSSGGGGRSWGGSLGAESLYGVFSAGITPLCYSLFALYDTQSRVWLPPNHLFEIGKDTNLNLLFRMR